MQKLKNSWKYERVKIKVINLQKLKTYILNPIQDDWESVVLSLWNSDVSVGTERKGKIHLNNVTYSPYFP